MSGAYIQVWTEPKKPGAHRKLYHWHIKAANGEVIATGGQGYNNLGDLWHGVSLVAKAMSYGLQNTLPVHDCKPE